MIGITLEQNENKFRLQMTGHAGYDQPGRDIVCSAASMLLYTLIENLRAEKITGWIEEGDVMLEYKCGIFSEERLALNAIAKGFRLLAKQHPEYVGIKECETGQSGELIMTMMK